MKLQKFSLVKVSLAGLFFLSACAHTPSPSETPQGTVSYLERDRIANLVSNTAILALVDPSPSEGSLQFKIDVTQKLISREGFSLVVLLASFGEVDRLNEWIHHEGGDLKKLIKNLPPEYRTETFKNFLSALKVQVLHEHEKIDLVGIDFQNIEANRDEVKQFLSRVSPESLAGFSLLNELQVHHLLKDLADKNSRVKGDAEFTRILKQAEIMKQFAIAKVDPTGSIRAEFLARNLVWQMEHNDFEPKTVIWGGVKDLLHPASGEKSLEFYLEDDFRLSFKNLAVIDGANEKFLGADNVSGKFVLPVHSPLRDWFNWIVSLPPSAPIR